MRLTFDSGTCLLLLPELAPGCEVTLPAPGRLRAALDALRPGELTPLLAEDAWTLWAEPSGHLSLDLHALPAGGCGLFMCPIRSAAPLVEALRATLALAAPEARGPGGGPAADPLDDVYRWAGRLQSEVAQLKAASGRLLK